MGDNGRAEFGSCKATLITKPSIGGASHPSHSIRNTASDATFQALADRLSTSERTVPSFASTVYYYDNLHTMLSFSKKKNEARQVVIDYFRQFGLGSRGRIIMYL